MHSCCSELGLKPKAKGLNTHHAFAQVEDEHYEFFQPLLRAGTHYLDAGRNATALHAALAGARADDGLSERVGRAGQAFAGACLGMEDVYNYMAKLLEVYASALNYAGQLAQMRLPPGAVRIATHADIDALNL